MNKTIHFIKMHGVGNDYIFVDTTLYPIPDPQALSVVWSRYHTGIGSDGLVLIGRSPSPEADFTMRIFNADGSEGLMCGNASRCIGKYVYERALTDKTSLRLLTEEERVDEIARMVGSSADLDSSRTHARNLLEAAAKKR